MLDEGFMSPNWFADFVKVGLLSYRATFVGDTFCKKSDKPSVI